MEILNTGKHRSDIVQFIVESVALSLWLNRIPGRVEGESGKRLLSRCGQ